MEQNISLSPCPFLAPFVKGNRNVENGKPENILKTR